MTAVKIIIGTILGASAALIIVAIVGGFKEDKPPAPALDVGRAGQLVARLLPLTQCAKRLGPSYCGEYDIGITVSPKGIRLRFKMGERDYDLLAPTLEEVVSGISAPPLAVTQALEGWK